MSCLSNMFAMLAYTVDFTNNLKANVHASILHLDSLHRRTQRPGAPLRQSYALNSRLMLANQHCPASRQRYVAFSASQIMKVTLRILHRRCCASTDEDGIRFAPEASGLVCVVEPKGNVFPCTYQVPYHVVYECVSDVLSTS